MFYEYIYLDSEKIKQFSLNLGINFLMLQKTPKREKGIKAKVAAGIVSTEFEAKEEQNYKNQQSEIQIFTKFKDRLEKVDNGSFVNSNHYRELEYIN